MSESQQRSWSRFFARLMGLGAVIAVACLIAHALLPYPWGDPALKAKLEHFIDHNEPYDAVFIGSSYTYRQISPKVFDRELGALGRASRSFNLGIDGMHLPATGYLVEHLAERDLPSLRTIYLELGRFTSAVDSDIDHSTPAKFWRTPALTGSMIRFLWQRPDKSFGAKVYQTARLAGIQLEAGLHIGQGAAMVSHWLGLDRSESRRALGPDRDGFYAVDRQVLELTGAPLSNRFLRNPEAAGVLETLRRSSQEAFEADLGPANREGLSVLRALMASVQAQGRRLVFVVPPRMGERYGHLRPLLPHLPEDRVIQRLADPRLHGSLYALEDSADRGHLNEQGARRFSRLLAQEVFRLRTAQGVTDPSSDT